ncbi:MAG: T9SS type A sorting domain-containing protein [FCB group bacterium]|nr:T9SS type A sorting domain-containing protein [FCB group bacterium]
MKKSYRLTAVIFLVLPLILSAQVQITSTNTYFTAGQMLLANEINESGEPFAEALGYNLDNLDPFVADFPDSIAYTLGIENYEYSRYQLGTIISRSGMGLNMMWAPIIGQMAAMETDPDFDGMYTMGMSNGFNEDDELMKNIMHFSMLTNHAAPGNPWPQFAEFISGDPHLPQAIDPENFTWADFSTLRWDRSLMDKTLNPAAMGQTLMKQYLWAQDMLGAFHDADDNGIDPDGITSPDFDGGFEFDPDNNIFFGGDGLDGFIGMVLTAEAINKVKFIISQLAYDGSSLGMVDPMTYDPMNGIKYFPHKIAVTETSVHPMLPPKPDSFTVTDESSQLFDQVSLLWGTLNFKNMMDPNNSSDAQHMAYHSVFDNDPFPADMSQTGVPGPFDLMKGASKVILQNLFALHYNGDSGTFVDESGLSGGMPAPGSVISTVNAGYLLAIFKQAIEEFAGTPLEEMAYDALVAQADFLIDNLQGNDGSYYNAFTLGEGADMSTELVESQAAAVRGLYAAYEATGNGDYLNAADAAYAALIGNFYVPAARAFRTLAGYGMSTYTPYNFAIIAGALREAALVGGHAEAPAIYTRYFSTVADAMQLSEGAPTGEAGTDSDSDGIPFIPEQPENLPPVFASEATFNLAAAAGLAGDVNMDAEVNIFDILLMVDFILFPENPPSDVQLAFGDLNEDGTINIFDVVTVITVILNGSSGRESEGFAEVTQTDNSILISGENIAGVELHTSGLGSFTDLDFPSDWQVRSAEGILVGFSTGELLSGSIAISYSGDLEIDKLLLSGGTGKSIGFGQTITPAEFVLHPAYPNPFNPSTTLQFEIPEDSRITVTVYDLAGRQVAELADDIFSAGAHAVTWQAGDAASGTYLVKLDSENYHQTRKILLMK